MDFKKSLKSRKLDYSSQDQNIDFLCVDVGECNLKVSVLYKPPSCNSEIFLIDLETILSKYPQKHILVGDMNVNLLEDSNITNNYKNQLTLCNFKINNVVSSENATRVTANSETLINHVMSTCHSNLVSNLKVKENPLSDHSLLLFRISNEFKVYKPKVNVSIKFVDYKRLISNFAQQKVFPFRPLKS